jgi:hypothetical protein
MIHLGDPSTLPITPPPIGKTMTEGSAKYPLLGLNDPEN